MEIAEAGAAPEPPSAEKPKDPNRDALGRLRKGVVLNPAGRPPMRSIIVEAKKHTAKAMAKLVGIMDNPDAPLTVQADAAKYLIDRGWGRAPQQIDVNLRSDFDSFLRDMGLVAAQQEAQEALDIEDGELIEAQDTNNVHADQLIGSSTDLGEARSQEAGESADEAMRGDGDEVEW